MVNWFWEPTGATGKSWLARHLALHHNAVHVQMMKRDDMLHVLANRIKTTSKIIVFDITRTTVVDNPLMIYEILEMIKVNIFSRMGIICPQSNIISVWAIVLTSFYYLSVWAIVLTFFIITGWSDQQRQVRVLRDPCHADARCRVFKLGATRRDDVCGSLEHRRNRRDGLVYSAAFSCVKSATANGDTHQACLGCCHGPPAGGFRVLAVVLAADVPRDAPVFDF